METASGTILSVADQTAIVELNTPIACSRCAAGRGCGAGLLTADRRRRISVPVSSNSKLASGDKVQLVVDARNLLRAAFMAYGIPLAGLLAAVAGAAAVMPGIGDPGIALAGIAGLAAGASFSRWRIGQRASCTRYTPVLERPGSL